MREEKAVYLTALKSLPRMGDKKLETLLSFWSTPREVWEARPKNWAEVLDTKEESLKDLEKAFEETDLSHLERVLEDNSITAVMVRDEGYPELLKEIETPPLCLFIRGQVDFDIPCLSVVGSRRASHYGKRVARELAQELAGCGFAIVSGLAKGIDALAHQGALDSGISHGVLAFGHGHMYPKENEKLAERILKKGALFSEYPFFTGPQPGYFPARNRIIAGLSLATIVVEAQSTSGSLITANFAMEQGRDVFAVPGNIYSENSRGCHNLIKQGAKLVEGIEDILDEFQYLIRPNSLQSTSSPKEMVELTLMQQKIIQSLEAEPRHIDVLVAELGLSGGVLLSELIQMEILGLVKVQPGGYYSI